MARKLIRRSTFQPQPQHAAAPNDLGPKIAFMWVGTGVAVLIAGLMVLALHHFVRHTGYFG